MPLNKPCSIAEGITLTLLVSENDPHITMSHSIIVGRNVDWQWIKRGKNIISKIEIA